MLFVVFIIICSFSENHKIRNNKNLFTIALTIPISSATLESSFSDMKKIKTWLRTSLIHDWFSDLSILYIEKDISNI
jgi:hypothetical protein